MPYSAREWLRAADFWRRLSGKQKLQFIEVTQTPPVDPHAGLWDIHAKLWHRQQSRKSRHLVLLFFRMALNINSALNANMGLLTELPVGTVHGKIDFPWDLYHFWQNPRGEMMAESAAVGDLDEKKLRLTLFNSSQACASVELLSRNASESLMLNVLDQGSGATQVIRYCWHDCQIGADCPWTGPIGRSRRLGRNEDEASWSWICHTRRGRGFWFMALLVSRIELLVVTYLAVTVAVAFVMFVVVGSEQFLVSFPSFVLYAPRRLGTFSMFKLLRFMNPLVLRKVPDRVNMLVLAALGTSAQRGRYRELSSVLSKVVGISAGVLMIIGGVLGIFVKLTSLVWVVTQDMNAWNGDQYIQLVGFLNQLSAIVDVDKEQLDTLFVFRFAGTDGAWTLDELRRRQAYVMLLCMKMLVGKAERGPVERLVNWTCLATFNAEDLQRLWLCPDLEMGGTDLNNSSGAIGSEVLELNRRLDPAYWPPRGSDPRWRLIPGDDAFERVSFEQAAREVSIDDNLTPRSRTRLAAGESADPRLSYFLENMQSYRMWMEEGGTGALWFYDEHGDLTHGGAREAVAPRVAQLNDQLRAVLPEGIGMASGASAWAFAGITRRQLEHAAKLEAEIEDLRLIDQRNIQNLVRRTETDGENAADQPRSARARKRITSGVSSFSSGANQKGGTSRGRTSLISRSGNSFLSGPRSSRLYRSSTSARFSKNTSKMERYLETLPKDEGTSSGGFGAVSRGSIGAVSRGSTGHANPRTSGRNSARRNSPSHGTAIRGASPGLRTSRHETQHEKGETLDVFLQLNATHCDTEQTLRLALTALELPESLASVKRVAHHRSRRLKRMQTLTDELERALHDPGDLSTAALRTLVESAGVLVESTAADKAMAGVEEWTKRLQKAHGLLLDALTRGQGSARTSNLTSHRVLELADPRSWTGRSSARTLDANSGKPMRSSLGSPRGAGAFPPGAPLLLHLAEPKKPRSPWEQAVSARTAVSRGFEPNSSAGTDEATESTTRRGGRVTFQDGLPESDVLAGNLTRSHSAPSRASKPRHPSQVTTSSDSHSESRSVRFGSGSASVLLSDVSLSSSFGFIPTDLELGARNSSPAQAGQFRMPTVVSDGGDSFQMSSFQSGKSGSSFDRGNSVHGSVWSRLATTHNDSDGSDGKPNRRSASPSASSSGSEIFETNTAGDVSGAAEEALAPQPSPRKPKPRTTAPAGFPAHWCIDSKPHRS